MSDVLLSIDDQVATLTINRPEKGNAITLDAFSLMSGHLDDLATGLVRAVVITGADDQFRFHSGVPS